MGKIANLIAAENPEAPEGPGLGTIAAQGVKAGAAALVGGAGGAVESLRDTAPNIASQGAALRQQMEEVQRNAQLAAGAEQGLAGIQSAGDLLDYATFTAASQIPNLALWAAGGLAGKAAGTAIGLTRGAQVTRAAGGVAATIPTTYGQEFANLSENNVAGATDAELRALAARSAVPQAALDVLPLEFITRSGAVRSAASTLPRRLASGTARGVAGLAATEVPTELAQETISQYAQSQVDPTAVVSLDNPEYARRLAEAGFGALASSFLLGGGAGAVRSFREPTVSAAPDQVSPDVPAQEAPVQAAPAAPANIPAELTAAPLPSDTRGGIQGRFASPAELQAYVDQRNLDVEANRAVSRTFADIEGQSGEGIFDQMAALIAENQRETGTRTTQEQQTVIADNLRRAYDVFVAENGYPPTVEGLLSAPTDQSRTLPVPYNQERPLTEERGRQILSLPAEVQTTGEAPATTDLVRRLVSNPVATTPRPAQVVEPAPVETGYSSAVRPNLASDSFQPIRELVTDTDAVIQSRVAGFQAMLNGEYGQLSETQTSDINRYMDYAQQEMQFRADNPEISAENTRAREQRLDELDAGQRPAFGAGVQEVQVINMDPSEILSDERNFDRFMSETDEWSGDPGLSELEGRQFSRAIPNDAQQKFAASSVEIRNLVDDMIGPFRVDIKRTRQNYYDPVSSVISVAFNQANPLSTAAHEAYHAAAEKVMTRSERSIVTAAFADGTKMNQRLREAALDLWENAPDVIDHMDIDGEAEAYAFQAWREGALKPSGVVERVFRKVQNFFERVRNAVEGKGFQNWEDVFNALNTGKYAARPVLKQAWKTSDMPKRMYSIAQEVPQDSQAAEISKVLENIHTVIPESSLRNKFNIPNKGSVRDHLQRAWGTVGTMYNVARTSPQAMKVMSQVDAMYRLRDSMTSDADVAFEEWINTRDQKAMDQASTALFSFTRERHNTVGEDILVGLSLDSDRDFQTLQELGAYTDAELRQRGMSDAAIKLYKDARSAINQLQRRSFQERRLDLLGNNSPAAQERLRLYGEQMKRNIAEGYMPLNRDGAFGVNVVHKKKTVGFFTFDTQAEAENAEKLLAETLSKYEGVTTEMSRLSKERLTTSGASVASMLEMIDNLDLTLQNSDRERLIKALTEADSMSRKRLLRRENIPGFSRDALRTMAKMIQDTSSRTASAIYAPRLTKLVNDTAAWRREGTNSGYSRDKIVDMVNFVQSPDGMDEAGSFQKLRTAAYVMHLGGTLGSGIANLSQLSIASLPYTAQFTSTSNAFTKLVSSIRQFGAPRYGDPAKIDVELRKLAGKRDAESVRQRNRLSALRQATAEGVLNPSRTLAIMGVANGRMMARSQKMRGFLDAWMTPMSFTEGLNRRATFMAAFDIATEIGNSNPSLIGPNGRFKDVMDFATRAVHETQGIASRYNRPGFGRQGIGSVLYTFKGFPTMMVELAMHMDNKGRSLMMGMLFLGAGMTGLPFADDMLAASQGIAKLLGIDWQPLRLPEVAIRQVLDPIDRAIPFANTTDIFMNGLLDAAGVNVSSRIGLGRIVPGMQGLSRNDIGMALWEILGPAGQPVVTGAGATARLAQGDILGAARNAPVRAIADAANLADQILTGEQRDKQGNVVAPATLGSMLMKAAGFSSTELSREYQAMNIIYDYQEWKTDATKGFRQDLVRAYREGPEAVKAVIDSINAWNQSHPNPRDRITIDYGDALRQSRARTLTERRTGGQSAKQRAEMNGLLRSVGIEPGDL